MQLSRPVQWTRHNVRGPLLAALSTLRDPACLKKPYFLGGALLLCTVTSAITLLWGGRAINGPFIFADEAVYFDIARHFFTQFRYFPDGSYNPLYPFVISPAFFSGHVGSTYEIIRVMNAFVFSTIVIPAYLFCRELRFGREISVFLACLVTALPFSVYSQLIWAEPLFYPLAAWAMLFALKFFRERSALQATLLGLSMGFLYLAKQYGIFFAVSAASVAMMTVVLEPSNRLRNVRNVALIILGLSVTIGALMLRNELAHSGGNPIGYQPLLNAYVQKLTSLGWGHAPRAVLDASLYQLAEIVFDTYGLAVFALLGAAFGARVWPRELNLFNLYLFVAVGGIALLSGIHGMSFDLPYYPNGRYISSFTPFTTIVAIRMLTWPGRARVAPVWVVISAIIAATALLYAFTPLRSLQALSLVNNAELSFLNYFIHPGSWIWTLDAPYSEGQRIGVSALIFSMMFIFASTRRWAWAVVLPLLLIFVLFQNYQANRLVALLSSSAWSANDIFRYVTAAADRGQVTQFDGELKKAYNYFDYFWLGSNSLSLMKPLAVMANFAVDFAGVRAKAKSDAVIVSLRAGDRSVPVKSAGIPGLVVPEAPDLRRCEAASGRESGFLVGGSTAAQFVFPTGAGHYRISVRTGKAESCGRLPLDFRVLVNGRDVGEISGAGGTERALSINEKSASKITVDLIPAKGSAWAIEEIGLASMGSTSRRPTFYVSRHALPLSVALKSANTFVYRTSEGSGRMSVGE